VRCRAAIGRQAVQPRVRAQPACRGSAGQSRAQRRRCERYALGTVPRAQVHRLAEPPPRLRSHDSNSLWLRLDRIQGC